MSEEAKPNIEGAKKFRQPMRAAGQPTKKEFVTKVLGLKSHTFDIGNANYTAKYKKTVDAIANYKQREYKGGADITKAIKELSLPTLQVPEYPKAKAGETVVDPGDVCWSPIWNEPRTGSGIPKLEILTNPYPNRFGDPQTNKGSPF